MFIVICGLFGCRETVNIWSVSAKIMYVKCGFHIIIEIEASSESQCNLCEIVQRNAFVHVWIKVIYAICSVGGRLAPNTCDLGCLSLQKLFSDDFHLKLTGKFFEFSLYILPNLFDVKMMKLKKKSVIFYNIYWARLRVYITRFYFK